MKIHMDKAINQAVRAQDADLAALTTVAARLNYSHNSVLRKQVERLGHCPNAFEMLADEGDEDALPKRTKRGPHARERMNDES